MTTLRNTLTSSSNNPALGSTPQSSPSKHPRHPLNVLPVLPSSPPRMQIFNGASDPIPIPPEIASSLQTEPIQPRRHQSPSPTRSRRGRKRKQISPTRLNDSVAKPSSISDHRKFLDVLDYMKRKKLSVPNFLAEYIHLDHSIDGEDDDIHLQKSAAARRRAGIARTLLDAETQKLLHVAEDDLLISARRTATLDPFIFSAELNRLKTARAFR